MKNSNLIIFKVSLFVCTITAALAFFLASVAKAQFSSGSKTPTGCCLNDKIVALTGSGGIANAAQQCQQSGGVVVYYGKVGDVCGQSAVKGWCCVKDKVVASTSGQCKNYGGTFYAIDDKHNALTNCGQQAGGRRHN